MRGDGVDEEEVLIFDKGSWQDHTELTNNKNNEDISCADEGDLIKIRKSASPSRALLQNSGANVRRLNSIAKSMAVEDN